MIEKIKSIISKLIKMYLVPLLFVSIVVCIFKNDYHRANYFILLYLGILVSDRLGDLTRSVDLVWNRLYKRNKEDGIE